MPPAKSRPANDEPDKEKTPTAKEKHSHGNGGQSNGKARRGTVSTGSQLKDVMNAANMPVTVPTPQASVAPSIQWDTFDRSLLHAYRRAYRLNTPTSFSSEYHRLVLSQPGGIGLQSPTMARRKDMRRQSKDQLTSVARKHFNGLGMQENDVIVNFLHKVRSQGVSKPVRTSLARQPDGHGHEKNR